MNQEGTAVNSEPQQQRVDANGQPVEPVQLGAAQVRSMTPAQVIAAERAGQFRDYFATPNPGGNH